VGAVLGGLGALIYLVVLRRSSKEYMAYAPYLSLGAILSFFLASP
jgi:prepilin signal peptidase PulO-like enzyme (type II secretory pathway)